MLDVIIGRHIWNYQIRTHIHTGYTHTGTHTKKKLGTKRVASCSIKHTQTTISFTFTKTISTMGWAQQMSSFFSVAVHSRSDHMPSLPGDNGQHAGSSPKSRALGFSMAVHSWSDHMLTLPGDNGQQVPPMHILRQASRQESSSSIGSSRGASQEFAWEARALCCGSASTRNASAACRRCRATMCSKCTPCAFSTRPIGTCHATNKPTNQRQISFVSILRDEHLEFLIAYRTPINKHPFQPRSNSPGLIYTLSMSWHDSM